MPAVTISSTVGNGWLFFQVHLSAVRLELASKFSASCRDQLSSQSRTGGYNYFQLSKSARLSDYYWKVSLVKAVCPRSRSTMQSGQDLHKKLPGICWYWYSVSWYNQLSCQAKPSGYS
jgi:hypothetical protein